ncbi:hypothetical protein BH11ARM1_BH11ARM1_18500 [soil metagenome]
MDYRYETDLSDVNWEALKAALVAADFCNGRTPDEYRRSAEVSHLNVYVYFGNEMIGNGRILSDGVCNGYIVDIWTAPDHRRRGIASRVLSILKESVPGQHIYLQTDDSQTLYRRAGFEDQPHGMSVVVGSWLNRR